jgi:hypothetical protein
MWRKASDTTNAMRVTGDKPSNHGKPPPALATQHWLAACGRPVAWPPKKEER